MEFKNTGFDGLIEIQPNVYQDNRGYFFESYKKDTFSEFGIDDDFTQSNQSFSSKNVVRGLHLQLPPFAQSKLVRVIVGKVLDIVVDVRKSSKTYGQHYKCVLSGEKNNMLYVPKGFAHGFTALEDSHFHYMVNNNYNKNAETGIRWDDETLNIDWETSTPVISDKDKVLNNFEEFEKLNLFE